MKQALEMTGLQARQSWLKQVLGLIFATPQRDKLVRPDLLSRQMLRDIGFGEEVRGNPLLRDGWLRR